MIDSDVLSDTTNDRYFFRRYSKQISDINERLNVLHKMSTTIHIDRRRNKIVFLVLGIVILIADITSMILKIVRHD